MKHLLRMAMLVCVALSGCSSLLPCSSSETDGRFITFESAQAAAQRIVPLQTQAVYGWVRSSRQEKGLVPC